MVCSFLLYSKVNQLHVYIYPVFFGFSSCLDHHRALNSSLSYPQVFISYLFIQSINSVYMSNLNLPVYPIHPAFPLVIHTFVLYVCVSISALHIRS